MKIYITGISGTGKSSIAKELTARGINAIDIDKVSHWENKATKERTGWEAGATDEWMLAHDWICDVDKLQEIISRTPDAVAVGHSSNEDAYLPLFDKVFTLRCTPETIIHRLNTRTDNDFGKHPEDMKRILEWHKDFDEWMIRDKGAQPLDGEKPLADIVDEVISHFN